jgi:hypothetical protein
LPSSANAIADRQSCSAWSREDTRALDAGVDLRDAQVAARHADPRTMRYDRARGNLDRHILAALMASGT